MRHVARSASQKESSVQNQNMSNAKVTQTRQPARRLDFELHCISLLHQLNIGSAGFILFLFEEVIQQLMNQFNMNLKFYFKQCHTVKQHF